MKTPEELGITEEEFKNLLIVKSLLDSERLTYYYEETDSPFRFNMNTTSSGDEYECGSVACIGGWVSFFMQGNKFTKESIMKIDHVIADNYVLKSRSTSLERLYFPELKNNTEDADFYQAITPGEASQAIQNFLETGDPDWDSILNNDVLKIRMEQISEHF